MHYTLLSAILLAISVLETAALPKAAIPVEKRFASGQCGAHIVQYQKNEGPGDQSQYRLQINLYDAGHAEAGDIAPTDATPDAPVDVDGPLPYVFEATVGFVDSDPIQFHYGGQFWESTGAQCSMGKYDSGSRNGDCGFSC